MLTFLGSVASRSCIVELMRWILSELAGRRRKEGQGQGGREGGRGMRRPIVATPTWPGSEIGRGPGAGIVRRPGGEIVRRPGEGIVRRPGGEIARSRDSHQSRHLRLGGDYVGRYEVEHEAPEGHWDCDCREEQETLLRRQGRR